MSGGERRTALRRGAVLLDAGRTTDAASVYLELLREDPLDVHAMCCLSRCLGRLGRRQEALDLAGRAVALAPENDWPHRLRSAHLLQLRRGPEALRAAEDAVRLDPAGLGSLLTLFEAVVATRDRRRAGEVAARLLQVHPDQPESHNCAGRAAMVRSEWQAAGAAFAQALRLRPQEPVYQSNLALALERQGRRAEAMSLFHQAVRTDPGSARARRQLFLAVDRRMAVVGAGVVAAIAVRAATLGLDGAGASLPVLVAAAAVVTALVTAAIVAVRRRRLDGLEESVRRFYEMERRRLRPLGRVRAVYLAVLVGMAAAALGATAWLTRGSADTVLPTAAFLAVAVACGAPRVWRARLLPQVHARRGTVEE